MIDLVQSTYDDVMARLYGFDIDFRCHGVQSNGAVRSSAPPDGCPWGRPSVPVAIGSLSRTGKLTHRLISYEVRYWIRSVNRLCGLRMYLAQNRHVVEDGVSFFWHPNSSFAYLPCDPQFPGRAYLDRSGIMKASTRWNARIGFRQRIWHEGGHAIGLMHNHGCILSNGANSIMRGFTSDIWPRYCRGGNKSIGKLRLWYGR